MEKIELKKCKKMKFKAQPKKKVSLCENNSKIWGEMARNFTFNLTYSLIYRLLPKYFAGNLACKIQIPCY